MTHRLNPDISYCQLDGRLFFLDIGRDRYFQLSSALERRFLEVVKAPPTQDFDIGALSKHGLFSSSAAPPIDVAAPFVDSPEASAIEVSSDIDCHASCGMVWGVWSAVATMYWQLKRRPLKAILRDLTSYREAFAQIPKAADNEGDTRRRIVIAAAAFNRLRPYVPIESRCLIDSLSIVQFLAKRGLPAYLVMGIACDPFSAHAWVQYGNVVLNDTVGNAQAHVPIRVV